MEAFNVQLATDMRGIYVYCVQRIVIHAHLHLYADFAHTTIL